MAPGSDATARLAALRSQHNPSLFHLSQVQRCFLAWDLWLTASHPPLPG